MRVLLITLVTLFVFGDHFGSAHFVNHCLCPNYKKSKDPNIGFCGHEIIKMRTAANQLNKKCIPTARYVCVYGPNGRSIEILCEENEKCIPGSPLYDKIKEDTNKDYSRNTSRGCATQEGILYSEL